MSSRDVVTRARSIPEMQMRHPIQQQLFDPDPLIDKEGAARCLGVEQRFINRLVSEKRITYEKVGRKIRFRQSTIEAYIIANTIDVGRPPDMRRPEERLVAARGWMRLVEILSREAPSLFGSALDVRGSARVVDGLYPVPHSPLFDFNATGDGAEWIDDIARTAWRTLQDLQAPARIVHMDWRPDNFRVNDVGDELVAIYDWDSLRVEPEASALGQVAARHSIDLSLPSGPHFADAAGCVAFAVDAEKARSRPFSDKEWSVIRAAIAYGWCYTARCEHARAYVGDDKPQFQMRHRLVSMAGRFLA